MTPPLLSARGLAKRFGAVVAAENIDIDVPAGQRLSVIGSNGAGKTTFVNMVTGYLKPDAGTISLEGEDITHLSHQRIARLGICRSFQIPQLCLELTLRQNLLVAIAAAAGRPSLWRPADGDAEHARADASRPTPGGRCSNSPAACASWPTSRSRSRAGPSCCCSTSRPRVSAPTRSFRRCAA
jgi:branched-chain amino acid transport system ATP-binding protein